MDFYDDAKRGAGSVKDSIDFVASYAGRTEEWPYQEINGNVEVSLWHMLKEAQLVDDRQSVDDALSALIYEEPDSRTNLIIGD